MWRIQRFTMCRRMHNRWCAMLSLTAGMCRLSASISKVVWTTRSLCRNCCYRRNAGESQGKAEPTYWSSSRLVDRGFVQWHLFRTGLSLPQALYMSWRIDGALHQVPSNNQKVCERIVRSLPWKPFQELKAVRWWRWWTQGGSEHQAALGIVDLQS